MKTIRLETLQEFLEDFVAAEGRRREMPDFWRPPILASAPADERFDILPEIAMDEHLLPRDLLPTAKSVLVFFIPFQKWLVRENRGGERPCRNWGLAYVKTNELIERASKALGGLLEKEGFRVALTPATHNFDEEKLMARWSHKHLGHLVGLGRFGTHCMLITPEGCCGRFGSLATNAELGDHPLVTTAEACLLKAGKKCGKCIQMCPVGALEEGAFDRRKCWERLNENYRDLEYLADLPGTTDVCGKCAAMLPCSFVTPVKPRSR
ncbi:MAG: epoxyqueuosine reductase [Deltaproteobacteria bacterium]|nr:epoxyqueuosine reductase [Deltaproteobacteria bacterium]